ncbi:MAG: SRPBCC family protein [Candidatus Sericytochromatia bacterium]|nr:SRPBCC family protein [Candidatus Sericytochromatia bacterium]
MLLAATLASAMQMPFLTDLLEGFSPAPDPDGEGIVVRIRDTERDSMKIVQGQINAPVPPAVLWSVITDYEAYPRIFDRYRKMEILEKSGSWELHRSEVDYPIFGSRWVSNVLQHDRPGLKIRFQRAEGTIKQVEGVWTLKETAPGRSMMRYAVRLDPGLPFVPSWVVTWGTQTMMPSILRSVANEAVKRHRATAKAS